MTLVDWLSVASGGASLILAIVAIILSAYFYSQSKNTEASVKVTLASIKAQTDALQNLSGKWMDRFTRYATENNPANEALQHVLQTMSNQPIKALFESVTHNDLEGMKTESVTCYIAIYYYCCLANIFAQTNLPNVDAYDEKNEFHILVNRIVNESEADVRHMQQTLKNISSRMINENNLIHLYSIVNNFYINFIKDSTATFASRNNS